MAVSKPLAGQQIDRTAPYAGSLLGAWAFNEGGGLRVNDSVGVRSAAGGSSVGLTWGGIGGIFNGSSTYVDVSGANSRLLKTSKFSGLAQFKTTSATQQTLIGAWAVSSSPGWEFAITNTGAIGFLFADSNGLNYIVSITTATFKDGLSHVAKFVYDGSVTAAGISIYVDGIKRAVTTSTVGTGDPGTVTSFTTVVGKRLSGGGANFVSGQIGIAALWANKLDAGFASAITSIPWQLWDDPQLVFAPASTYPAWVLSSGEILYKQAATSGDKKIYLSSGALVAKTSASAGDKLITLSSGTPLAT